MIGLKAARIVVIDDNPLEALPIIHALGRYGMGAVYVRGDKVEELPKEKLRGVRLVFLDMKLNIEGEDKTIVSKTVNVLANVIHETASPSVIVIWTKHDELVHEFKARLREVMPNLRPGIILKLDKPFDYEDQKWPATMFKSFGAIRKVEKAVCDHPPLDLLWYWEQRVHDSTTEVTGALADLAACAESSEEALCASARTDKWFTGMTELLAAIVNGVGGATIVDARSSLRAMFTGMNPLVSDRILHLRHNSGAIARSAGSVADQAKAERAKNDKKKSFLSGEQRARLNEMLLLAPADKNSRVSYVPGELYLKTRWVPDGAIPFPIGCKGVGNSAVVEEVVNLPRTKETDLSEKKAETRKKRRSLLRKCQTCLLEFTPPCDFAQQKAKMARLMAGVIVPADEGITLRRAGHYLKQLGIVQVDKANGFLFSGPAHLVLSARYVFGISIPHISQQTAACRIREEVLSDVCAWFASHAARPGLLSVY